MMNKNPLSPYLSALNRVCFSTITVRTGKEDDYIQSLPKLREKKMEDVTKFLTGQFVCTKYSYLSAAKNGVNFEKS